jgi:nucleoside-diphosphate-sugar epimerase
MGELACRTWSDVYGLQTVSLRYFNVYGARLDPRGAYALVMPRFLEQRKEGLPLTITGDGEQTRDFTHVRDVVAANLLAMDALQVGKGEVLNIGAGSNATINHVASLIGGPVVYVAARQEPRHTKADSTKARELLGWYPRVTLEEGVAALKREWGIV